MTFHAFYQGVDNDIDDDVALFPHLEGFHDFFRKFDIALSRSKIIYTCFKVLSLVLVMKEWKKCY